MDAKTIIMQEEVTFEIAVLAKEKGFNEKCNLYYSDCRNAIPQKIYPFITNEIINDEIKKDKFVTLVCSAPTQSLLQSWILENHYLFITVELAYNQNWGRYSASVHKKSKDGNTAIIAIDGFTIFDSPYDAFNEGLFESLKLIKNV